MNKIDEEADTMRMFNPLWQKREFDLKNHPFCDVLANAEHFIQLL